MPREAVTCRPNELSARCILEGIAACANWSEEHARRHLRMLRRSAESALPHDSVEFQDVIQKISGMARQKGILEVHEELVADGLIAA